MKTLSFKVTEEEARAIRQQARKEELTVSEFLRRRARGVGENPPVIEPTRCEWTGATILSGSAQLQPLTTASVREMLNDFP